MPRIQIQTPNGMQFTITSSDPELVGRWFSEVIHANFAPQDQYYDWRVTVQPLFVPSPDGRGQADWCADTSHWAHREFSFCDGLEGLIAALEKMRSAAQ